MTVWNAEVEGGLAMPLVLVLLFSAVRGGARMQPRLRRSGLKSLPLGLLKASHFSLVGLSALSVKWV